MYTFSELRWYRRHTIDKMEIKAFKTQFDLEITNLKQYGQRNVHINLNCMGIQDIRYRMWKAFRTV